MTLPGMVCAFRWSLSGNAEAGDVFEHGFPFIIAVKDHDKAGILRHFEERLGHDTETEFTTACRQVERIARLRLEDMM